MTAHAPANSIVGQPLQEDERLEALDRFDVLDTPSEEAFDRVARLARKIFRVRAAVVTMIDGHRQWYKAKEGLTSTETQKKITFCKHTIQSSEPLIIEDATGDERFADSLQVTGPPHIRFYAGAPLRTRDGHNIGTLCVVDMEPRAFATTDVEILTDLAQIVMDELELGDRASFDELTGICSRRAFKEATSDAIALAGRHKHKLACIVFDLDHFKTVNDTHGHAAGDEVLKRVAETCEKHLRQSDIFGRIGGEEFAVCLPHTDRAGALKVAEKLRAEIEKLRIDLGKTTLGITASFGVAAFDADSTDIDTMLANADVALYEAKSAGRNRCVAAQSKQKTSQSTRRRVLKAGRILFNNRISTMDCTVRTLAEDGAGLDVSSSVGIPEKFRLAIRSDNFESDCRIVSQTEKHIEVEFC